MIGLRGRLCRRIAFSRGSRFRGRVSIHTPLFASFGSFYVERGSLASAQASSTLSLQRWDEYLSSCCCHCRSSARVHFPLHYEILRAFLRLLSTQPAAGFLSNGIAALAP